MKIKGDKRKGYYFSCPRCGSRRSKRYCERCYQDERYVKKKAERAGIPWESICEEDKEVVRKAAIKIGCYLDDKGIIRPSKNKSWKEINDSDK